MKYRPAGGFTLLELIVSVAILGILVTIAISNFDHYGWVARIRRADAEVASYSTAVNGLFALYGAYPVNSLFADLGNSTVTQFSNMGGFWSFNCFFLPTNTSAQEEFRELCDMVQALSPGSFITDWSLSGCFPAFGNLSSTPGGSYYYSANPLGTSASVNFTCLPHSELSRLPKLNALSNGIISGDGTAVFPFF